MKKIMLATSAVTALMALAGCGPVYYPGYADGGAPAYYGSSSVVLYNNPSYVRYGAPPNTRFRDHDPKDRMGSAPYWHAQHNAPQNTQRNAPAAQARQGHAQGTHEER